MAGFRLQVVAIVFVWLFCNTATAQSLRDAVQEAVKTNPSIEAAQANYRATLSVLDQARGRFFPEVDLSADVGRQIIDRPKGLGPDINKDLRNRKQATVTVRQVLFDGFDRANDYYRSQSRITAASHRILARSESVALNAIEAYIDVRRHRRLLSLSRAHVRRHVELLEVIEERLEGGAAPIGDKEQTLERLEAARALEAQVEVALTAAVAKYKASVGSEPGRLQYVGYAQNLPRSVAKILEYALQNNPRVQAASSEIDIADFDTEQFKARLYPDLFLEGSASRGENLDGTPGRNDELKAMVVLRWSLLDGGQRRARIEELTERKYEKFAERDILVREIEMEIRTAWGRYTKGRAQVDSIRRRSEQNKKVIATYKDEYDANKRSLLDLLDAENANFGTEFELSSVEALHIFSSYNLLAQMGVLLERMDIENPVLDEMAFEKPQRFGLGNTLGDFTIPPLR